MIGGAVAVAAVVAGGTLAASALQVRDESGRPTGISGVIVQVDESGTAASPGTAGPGVTPTAVPTSASTAPPTTDDPSASPSPTGATTVPDPVPVVVDDHGGQNGKSGGGGGGHGSDG
ncbi:hypothetical protein B7R54_01375 [Subtercola boreus]|uniref:Uncharacterized protein n=2 Tax=Subtercola boreus TaxID=120213 RepID=A0A3E0VGL5_9MICO|nr:hypothetical protein B7R54_01375 [Subtercola boreus]